MPLLQDLGFWREFHGPYYGFDHIELARNHTDEYLVGQHYALWMEANGLNNWRDYFRPPTGTRSNQRWTWEIPEEYHYNAWITERTNALLKQYQQEDASFFLWASFFDPHPPYLVPRPWDTMYDPTQITVPSIVPEEHLRNPPHFQLTQQRDPDFSNYQEPGGHACHGFHSHLHDRQELAKNIAIYYGMVSCMDKYIGKIMKQLDALGMSRNTVVVFTTDHGHFFGQHGLVAKGPFHYEDLIRVPFIVSCPGTVPMGKYSDALQSLVDLAPTFLSFAHIDAPCTMTGIDQRAVWHGDVDHQREHVVVENRHQPTRIHAKTYIDHRYKLTIYYNHEYGELFDLQEDPMELHNRWGDVDYANLKSNLLLKFVHAEMEKEPLWMPRIAVA
jgi:uncharacterized sulfatase